MKTIVALAVAAGLLVSAVVQHRQMAAMRVDNAQLRESVHEVRTLKARLADHAAAAHRPDAEGEVARLHDENRELLKLRNEVQQLREHRAEFEKLRARNGELRSLAETVKASGGPATRPQVISTGDLSNQGFLTPEATVQTFFWAFRDGNMPVLARCLIPDGWSEVSRQFVNGSDVAQYFQDTNAIEIVVRREVTSDTVELGVALHSSRRIRKIILTLRFVSGQWRLDLDHLPA